MNSTRSRIAGLRAMPAWVAILNALDLYLRDEPERPNRSPIKRLRGKQDATCRRLRVRDYRVF